MDTSQLDPLAEKVAILIARRRQLRPDESHSEALAAVTEELKRALVDRKKQLADLKEAVVMFKELAKNAIASSVNGASSSRDESKDSQASTLSEAAINLLNMYHSMQAKDTTSTVISVTCSNARELSIAQGYFDSIGVSYTTSDAT